MSKLKEKSLFNITASKLLIDNNLYCSSVHCSYYSCFQLMKFTMKDFFDVDYSVLGTKISLSGKKTHRYIIDYLENEIHKNAGLRDARNFKHKIKDLKVFREESDYENVEISIEQGQKAYNIANELRSFLTQQFHV